MESRSVLKGKYRPRCQRCGGQLIRSYDDICCLQCGARHTKDGYLETIDAAIRLIVEQYITDQSASGRKRRYRTRSNPLSEDTKTTALKHIEDIIKIQ